MRTINLDNFNFFTDPPWNEGKVFRTLIPSSIKSTEELFKYYASLLQIGGYFGHNWSALDEILCDFEWINENEIEILHDGLPRLDSERDFKLYLEMLSDAVDFWNGKGINAPYLPQRKIKHKLIIYFPVDQKSRMEELISKK